MTKECSYRESHKAPDKGSVYDEHFETDQWRRFVWSREKRILLEILEKYFGRKDIYLLDFACGTGRIAAFLEDRVKKSTGIDVSSPMLAIARERLKRTEVIYGDITKKNILKGRKFNLITAFRFFLNAERELRLAVIKACAELLAEDGYFVFNNHWNLGSPRVKFSFIRHRSEYEQGTCNTMSINEMKDLVAKAGLEVAEIYPIGFFHLPKIPVCYRLNWVIDSMASRIRFLAGFSESPVAVCRWKKG